MLRRVACDLQEEVGMSVLIVAMGGAMGAVARYQTYLYFQPTPEHPIPIVTLLINFIGCFLIGVLMILIERDVPFNRHLLLIGVTGFLGSYTTFSAFGFETFKLIRDGQASWAIAYVLLSVCSGLIAILAGRYLV